MVYSIDEKLQKKALNHDLTLQSFRSRREDPEDSPENQLTLGGFGLILYVFLNFHSFSIEGFWP